MSDFQLITIVTPVWNGMPYLKECVESVLKQDYQNWELLISDDGSTDGSLEYLNSLQDSRVKIFKQGNNKGIFGNINFLFSKVTSNITQILCQDDYLIDSRSLNKIADYWHRADPRIGFVRFNNNKINRCSLTRYQKEVLPSVIHSNQADILFFLFGNIPGNLSNVSLRTEVVENSGFFNQQFPYAGDFEFWSRAANNYSFGVSDQDITYIRRHEAVASKLLNKKGELLSQKAKILEMLFNKIISKQPELLTKLKIHATINFDSKNRYTAVKHLLKGSVGHLVELNRVSSGSKVILGSAFQWLFFFVTLGGRIGRVKVTREILVRSK